jgi:hypothetical protein
MENHGCSLNFAANPAGAVDAPIASLALGLVIATACGCASRRESENPGGYSPAIVLTLDSISVTNDNCHIALFRIKNVSDADLWFTGNRRGEADYYVERELSIGGWEGDTSEGRSCGMDMAWCRLAAGASTNLPVPFWPRPEHAGRVRVGVRLSPTEFPTASTPNVIYWSAPLSP